MKTTFNLLCAALLLSAGLTASAHAAAPSPATLACVPSMIADESRFHILPYPPLTPPNLTPTLPVLPAPPIVHPVLPTPPVMPHIPLTPAQPSAKPLAYCPAVPPHWPKPIIVDPPTPQPRPIEYII